MAKARSRAAARKVKDRWKAKNWYNVLAPASFDNATIAETIADDPVKLNDRVTEISMQDLTNDFRKSHIKLSFKVSQIEDNNAKTEFIGHTLTSDYLRRMVRRRRSKIDAVYEAKTRDGARIRVKPFATTDRRIQNSQKKIIRLTMRKTIVSKAKAMTLSEFVKYIIEGKLGSDIYKSCKKYYPVRRIEIFKTEVIQQPTIEIEEPTPEEKKPAEPEEPESEEGEEETEETTEEEETSEVEEEPKTSEEKETSEEEPTEPEEPEESEEPVAEEEITGETEEEIPEEPKPEQEKEKKQDTPAPEELIEPEEEPESEEKKE
ncbi:MAG: 30S ribosomal protein S3ae [Candidatus Thermoplasmatota archaeon]|nr:30S ribosomal protein S3ae [Candidatus Thermoplasmatota archaeon]MBS3801735.1 30S ribosomal protein S3ae [Candidatus Thermoplasmatota archaeon]